MSQNGRAEASHAILRNGSAMLLTRRRQRRTTRTARLRPARRRPPLLPDPPAAPGHGPDYGHFVSKDFVTWAELPVASWTGVDSTTGVATPYDHEAIYTGSAVVVDGAGPGGTGPGVVNIYPGLCNKNDWPGCTTGTLLAQAVPADYAGDELTIGFNAKPSYAACAILPGAIRRNSGAILRNCAETPPLQVQPEGTQRDL